MKHLSGPDDPKLRWSVTKAALLIITVVAIAVLSSVYVAINVI